MTIIAQQDYPDYGRQVSQSDILIYEEIDTPISAITSLPTRFTGSSPWLGIQFTGPATRSELTLLWFSDEAGTSTIGADDIVVKTSTGSYVGLPVKGPFVQAIVDLTAFPNDFFLVATAVPHPVVQWSQVGGNKMISAINQSIAAGVTTTFNATQVASGWITVAAQMRTGTVATAQLFHRRFDNTRTLLDRWRVDAFAPNRRIYVPPYPLELDITNNDAAAQVVDAFATHGTPGNW